MMDRIVVPISCQTHSGWGQLSGVLSFDGQRLQFSYQTVDSLLGLLKSEPHTVDLSLGIINEINYGLGWFWLMPVIEISLSDFVTAARLPGSKAGRLPLRVAFRDRHQAKRLVDELRFVRSQYQYDRLTAEIEQMRIPKENSTTARELELPPPPPQSTRPRQLE
jgi:hypothetical protein